MLRDSCINFDILLCRAPYQACLLNMKQFIVSLVHYDLHRCPLIMSPEVHGNQNNNKEQPMSSRFLNLSPRLPSGGLTLPLSALSALSGHSRCCSLAARSFVRTAWRPPSVYRCLLIQTTHATGQSIAFRLLKQQQPQSHILVTPTTCISPTISLAFATASLANVRDVFVLLMSPGSTVTTSKARELVARHAFDNKKSATGAARDRKVRTTRQTQHSFARQIHARKE